jgi:TrmH family RNA methyltransferase
MRALRWYKELHTAAGRAAAGFFAVEGLRALSHILDNHPGSVDEIVMAEGCVCDPAPPGKVRTVTPRQFAGISTGTTPQGVMGIIALPPESRTADLPGEAGSRVLLLEGIQDPGNVGTLIRTAAAFDFSGVILSRECADPFSPKAVQASAGTVLGVWSRRTDNLPELARCLRRRGFALVAADTRGGSAQDCFTQPHVAIALGSEGQGLSGQLRALADHVFSLPHNPRRAESLNVAAAGAICMFLARSSGPSR